jgi:hypothetical protein
MVQEVLVIILLQLAVIELTLHSTQQDGLILLVQVE